MNPTETWTVTRPNATPSAVVQEFLDVLFPGRKPVAFAGAWTGLNYRGEFQLAGGNRWYAITADHYGHYTVSVV
jgi:hypothetical protein